MHDSLLRTMIDNAFQWAERNGHIRKNGVHGEQEARLVLTEDFSVQNKEGQDTTQSMSFDMNDTCLTIVYGLETCPRL